VIGVTAAGADGRGGVSFGVGALKTVAVALLAVTATPLAVAHFVTNVPDVVPSVEGWERIDGDFELKKPHVAVQYEFYVNPERPAIYEVVRYRVTELGTRGKGNHAYPTTEKLQWDRDGRDLRRFECVASAAAGGECVWRELEKGGNDYLREVGVLLWLYDLHHNSEKAAAASPLPAR
jgi:hypothetical protein